MPSSNSGKSYQAVRAKRRAAWRFFNPYILLLPAFFFIGVFIFWPVGYSFFLSTMSWKLGYAQREFILFGNYLQLFTSSEFWNAMANTAIYTGLMAGLSIAFGLGLSLAVVSTTRLTSMWQAMFFLPVAATMAAMAVVWRFIFDTHIGILNAFLAALNLEPVEWLLHGTTAMGAVILVGVWSNAGYAMVFFIAGLSNIPKTLHEAAAIDGANGFRRFLSITWPLLSPTTLFVVIIMTVRALASFDIV
jgi:multiple sugar transport system permease protein